MADILNDQDIENLLKEEKHTAVSVYVFFSQMREKKAHREADIIVPRPDGSYFKVILRQNSLNPLDFSAILGIVVKGSNQLIKLRRYNGKSHEHKNKLEAEQFYDFHIHHATERYQNIGYKEELYAIPTERYANLRDALKCLAQDCNIMFPGSNQMELF